MKSDNNWTPDSNLFHFINIKNISSIAVQTLKCYKISQTNKVKFGRNCFSGCALNFDFDRSKFNNEYLILNFLVNE